MKACIEGFLYDELLRAARVSSARGGDTDARGGVSVARSGGMRLNTFRTGRYEFGRLRQATHAPRTHAVHRGAHRRAAKRITVAAGVLLSAALTVLAPLAAGAQDTTFISNTGQSSESTGYTAHGTQRYAQSFRTGTATDGYNLTGVVLNFTRDRSFNPPTTTISLEVRADAGSNTPGSTTVANLNPTIRLTLSVGENTFTPQSATVLTPSTTYHLYIADTSNSGTGVLRTNSSSLDDGTATGWSIPARAQQYDGSNWIRQGSYIQFRILGTEASDEEPTDPEPMVPTEVSTVTARAETASLVGATGTFAVFIITRTAPTSADLEVDFTLGGDSNAYRTPSDDGSGSRTITAGNASVRVEVETASQEPSDRFPMTLTLDEPDDDRYTVADPPDNTATVTVTGPEPMPMPLPNKPVITGTVEVGQLLEADTSGIIDPSGLNDPPNWSYQWATANDAAGTGDVSITGATGRFYRPVAADQGKYLKVTVGFLTSTFSSRSRVSDWVLVGAATVSNTEATGKPRITGTVQVGRVLTAAPGNIDDDDGITGAVYSYQWQ